MGDLLNEFDFHDLLISSIAYNFRAGEAIIQIKIYDESIQDYYDVRLRYTEISNFNFEGIEIEPQNRIREIYSCHESAGSNGLIHAEFCLLTQSPEKSLIVSFEYKELIPEKLGIADW